jgi:hypothetical protein
VSVLDAAATVGKFLVEHPGIIDAAASAIEGGTPEDVIIAAIKGALVKESDDAIREELEAAEARDAGDEKP